MKATIPLVRAAPQALLRPAARNDFLARALRGLLAGIVADPGIVAGIGANDDDAGLTAAPIPPSLLRAEVEALPPDQRLAGVGSCSVVYARAAQIPWCLQEIGRLRELTFRGVGEGTGRATDLDLFDAYYLHLFVWDARGEMIVGAYRLGLADRIVDHYGLRGLYTHSLFRYGAALLRALPPAIELGRSFVRPEYQRSYAPLMLLWQGIARFVERSPRYAVLFGPVSISNDYSPLARQLMVEYLSANTLETRMVRHVRPRQPPRGRPLSPERRRELCEITDIDGLSRLVASIEGGRGVPPLLRQYLKLGGRLLGFSTDANFGDALDGLIMVDLRRSQPRVLARYMGEEAARAFLRHHAIGAPDTHRVEAAGR